MEGVRRVQVIELIKNVGKPGELACIIIYEVLTGGDVESVETQWEKFRDLVKEGTNDVCRMRRIWLEWCYFRMTKV